MHCQYASIVLASSLMAANQQCQYLPVLLAVRTNGSECQELHLSCLFLASHTQGHETAWEIGRHLHQLTSPLTAKVKST